MIAICRWFLPSMALALAATTAPLTATRAAMGDLDSQHWALEAGTADPSYAATVPVSTNINLDTVVLGCEGSGQHRVLQLQLYTADGGPLRPLHASRSSVPDDPKAEIAIDHQVFPATLAFADDYAVLADGDDGSVLSLSDRLLSAMQKGRTMTLRFDLVAPDGPRTTSFDAEAVVDLTAVGAQAAIAALRRCTAPRPPGGVAGTDVTH
jgi:hypothetical protein